MKPNLNTCYIAASAAYMGIGRLLQGETDAARIAVLERAQRHLEQGHQILGRLMEEEPMPTGIVDFFRCLLGMESWRSRRPGPALADQAEQSKAPEQAVRTAAAGHASTS